MKDYVPPPEAPLRAPAQVMRLSRMGSMFPTRLSFLRTLMRFLAAEKAQVSRLVWAMCARGYGHAVYSISFGGHTYALVAVSTELAPQDRTDRVIAEAWDSSYVLYDGVPDADEVARICATAPLQEAARFTERDLVLSRANKSVRLFQHVVERLRAGQQPDRRMVDEIGYLMRTTAVYGNGKFGIADRACIDTRPGLQGPFMAEMLTVWLIRQFTHDLVEHVGQGRLDRDLKRHLGIGNSTGLGMAPFLVTHPVLLNNWMLARETALARVRALRHLEPERATRLIALAGRAGRHLAEWRVPDAAHQARIDRLRADWAAFAAAMTAEALAKDGALARLVQASAAQSEDLQELLVALMLEPFPELVNGLADCMADPVGPLPDPLADTGQLREEIARSFDWALVPDYADDAQCKQFWYVSAAKQEPRLGNRFADSGAELESPLDIARRIKALFLDLPEWSEAVPAFLERYPDHLLAVQRVALTTRYPYAEIRDNLIGAGCRPIDMLRCKLAFFGASKFDPKSDRWTRITLCQGAPLADELDRRADDWWLPVFDA
ncbi:hypothetical protein So717_32180 [Roseobacter cerasinus]|uniref:Uncharacterized protein n=1 Tax=Roseobacter cerasinus TaxID=2602289 RepID=A0A640VX12_9RHOB|nr:hypothetical protein [Roseobacter cerasinus]GFE51465.1 hypothetical protein So717_32180 [Roseobacter cerasinus]